MGIRKKHGNVDIVRPSGIKSTTTRKKLMVQRKSRSNRNKPTVVGAWSPTEVFQFIRLVERHPCIWDYSIKSHKIANKRINAWNQVSAGLTIAHSPDECKAKWSNVKTIYQRVKSKQLPAIAEGAVPQWPYWSAMQFVEKIGLANSNSDDDDIDVGEAETAELGPTDDYDETQSQSRLSIGSTQTPAPYITSVWSIGDDAVECDEPPQVVDALKDVGQSEWQIIANYWALQLRSLAEFDPAVARRTHLEMTRVLVEESLAVAQRQFPKIDVSDNYN